MGSGRLSEFLKIAWLENGNVDFPFPVPELPSYHVRLEEDATLMSLLQDIWLFLSGHTVHCNLIRQVWWGWAEVFELPLLGAGSHFRLLT